MTARRSAFLLAHRLRLVFRKDASAFLRDAGNTSSGNPAMVRESRFDRTLVRRSRNRERADISCIPAGPEISSFRVRFLRVRGSADVSLALRRSECSGCLSTTRRRLPARFRLLLAILHRPPAASVLYLSGPFLPRCFLDFRFFWFPF